MVLVVADWENSPGLQFRDVMFEGRDRSPTVARITKYLGSFSPSSRVRALQQDAKRAKRYAHRQAKRVRATVYLVESGAVT